METFSENIKRTILLSVTITALISLIHRQEENEQLISLIDIDDTVFSKVFPIKCKHLHSEKKKKKRINSKKALVSKIKIGLKCEN